MKKLMLIGIAAAALAGCQSTEIKTPEWEVRIKSNMFKRDVDKVSVDRLADGSYSVYLNGYKGDVSERLPEFTREMWAGLGFLGQIAASLYNPAAASVKQTTANTSASCSDGSCKE